MDPTTILRRLAAKRAADSLRGHLRLLLEQDPDPELRQRAARVITAISQLT